MTYWRRRKKSAKETLFDAIENSLMTACKNHFGKADNIKVEIDRDTCDFLCYAEKEVVPTKEDVEDDCLQIALDDAKEISKKAKVGDILACGDQVQGIRTYCHHECQERDFTENPRRGKKRYLQPVL